MPAYRRLVVRVPRDLEEDVSARFFAASTLGVEWRDGAGTQEAEALAYFATGGENATAVDLPPGCRLLADETIADADWLATWRERSGPIAVGERLLVDPREPGEGESPEVPPGRFLLRLPARTAFGLGSHASTRLAWELVERLPLAGRRLLDVGTGSGILALGARLLGAARVVAFDLDPAAALLAGQYARDHDLALPVFVGRACALGARAGFDLLLCNVIPEELRADLPRLAELVAPGGEIIASGILERDAAAALDLFAEVGWRERQRLGDGEWVAFLLEAPR